MARAKEQRRMNRCTTWPSWVQMTECLTLSADVLGLGDGSTDEGGRRVDSTKLEGVLAHLWGSPGLSQRLLSEVFSLRVMAEPRFQAMSSGFPVSYPDPLQDCPVSDQGEG